MQWFRFYSEVLNDPKVQTLPSPIFKIWVNCLCVAANSGTPNGTIGTIEDVSFALRETKDSVSSAFRTLEQLGIIVTVDETFHIAQWKKRQFKSDTSTERVKQHRKRFSNVSVTPPDTDTDTDTDTEKKEDSAASRSDTTPEPPVSEKQSEKAKQARPPVPDWNGDNHADIPPAALVKLSADPRWGLPDDLFAHTQTLGWEETKIFDEIEKFFGYWHMGKGSGKRKSVKGWKQSWLNWIKIAANDQRR